VEAGFFEIEKFGYSVLVVEISVIERYCRVDACILEIHQIIFNHFIDHGIRIGKLIQKIFPQSSLLAPIAEWEMKFFDILLVLTKFVGFSLIADELLSCLDICIISE